MYKTVRKIIMNLYEKMKQELSMELKLMDTTMKGVSERVNHP